jgi:hypothetical protein
MIDGYPEAWLMALVTRRVTARSRTVATSPRSRGNPWATMAAIRRICALPREQTSRPWSSAAIAWLYPIPAEVCSVSKSVGEGFEEVRSLEPCLVRDHHLDGGRSGKHFTHIELPQGFRDVLAR